MTALLLLISFFAAAAFAAAVLCLFRSSPEDWWMLGYIEGFRDGHELGVIEATPASEGEAR